MSRSLPIRSGLYAGGGTERGRDLTGKEVHWEVRLMPCVRCMTWPGTALSSGFPHTLYIADCKWCVSGCDAAQLPREGGRFASRVKGRTSRFDELWSLAVRCRSGFSNFGLLASEAFTGK